MDGFRVRRIRRQRRKSGLRKRLLGTSDCPRLTVFRSHKHIYAQIIDDVKGTTLCEASTRNRELRGELKLTDNRAAAKAVGAALAERAKGKNITRICFDRNGYRFHGRVKQLADAAREGGLQF